MTFLYAGTGADTMLGGSGTDILYVEPAYGSAVSKAAGASSLTLDFGSGNMVDVVKNVETIVFTNQTSTYSELETAINTVDPLILDLDGGGIELISLSKSAAYFDMNFHGVAERTGWISGDDALLAIDRDGDGIINDLSELFFEYSAPGEASTGFTALATRDENSDVEINRDDAEFAQRLLRQDLNENGQSEDGELRSIEDAGITNISLATEALRDEVDGNTIETVETFTTSTGETGIAADVRFAFEAGSEEAEHLAPEQEDGQVGAGAITEEGEDKSADADPGIEEDGSETAGLDGVFDEAESPGV
jgi:hypothetical protein